jgi:serine/threonine protein kinase
LVSQCVDSPMKTRAPRKRAHGHEDTQAVSNKVICKLEQHTHRIKNFARRSTMEVKRHHQNVQMVPLDPTRGANVSRTGRHHHVGGHLITLRLHKLDHLPAQATRVRSHTPPNPWHNEELYQPFAQLIVPLADKMIHPVDQMAAPTTPYLVPTMDNVPNGANFFTCIHRGNRTEIILDRGPIAGCEAVPTEEPPLVQKRLLAFANVSTERHALFREAVMQCLGKGPGVIPVTAPCPGQLAEEEMHTLIRCYVEGRTLREFRHEAQRSPLERLALIASLLETLARLHSLIDERGAPLNLVHRDVTPGNVIIDHNSTVWLNDFGLALTGDELPLAADETLQGTRRFLAPELVRGEQPSSGSDVYQAMLLGAYLLDENHSEPPLDVEARAIWANALLTPLIVTAAPSLFDLALSENPEKRPSAQDLSILLREICGK